MNWTLQLLSHNLVLLYHLISLGTLTSIPLLSMYLRSSISLPEPHLLTMYKSQICPSLEYCSHVWGDAPKSALSSRQSPFKGHPSHNPNLTKSLQPLSHRRFTAYFINSIPQIIDHSKNVQFMECLAFLLPS